jgi:uncharacterized membrane protein
VTQLGQRATRGRVGQGVLAGATWAWVAALSFAPAVVFPIGHVICHQKPERSFFINGLQMAVCARCTGLYVGAAIAMPLALGFAAPLATSRARWIAVLAALPTFITWSVEFAGLAGFSNVLRFVAALPLGFAAAWLIVALLGEL